MAETETESEAETKNDRTRHTYKINKHDVMSADSAIGVSQYDLYDDSCPGLLIRVAAQSAAWYVRARVGKKQHMWRTKTLQRTDDPATIREWATEARLMAGRGCRAEDIALWLKEKGLGGKIERHFDPEKDGWEWETAREKFLAFVQAEKAPATYKDYRKTLRGKDLERWCGKLVKSITKADVQALQTDIYNRGAKTQAGHTVRIVRSCLSWVASTGKAGLEESPALNVKPIKTNGAKKRGRVPTAEEIGKLPWQLDAARISPSHRLASLLVLFTAQRRESVMSACVEDFVEVDGYGLVWMVEHTKRKRKPDDPGHVLPLPPAAAAVARAAIAAVGTRSGWVFPQARLRRAGDAGDGHMASQTPEKAMKKAGSEINPHDVRRAFPKAVEEELDPGFTRSEVKLILDHAEGQSGDVTKKHYAFHAQLRAKKPVLDGWNQWVLDQVAAQRPDGAQGLPGVLAMLEVS